jgi:hypothetical protein
VTLIVEVKFITSTIRTHSRMIDQINHRYTFSDGWFVKGENIRGGRTLLYESRSFWVEMKWSAWRFLEIVYFVQKILNGCSEICDIRNNSLRHDPNSDGSYKTQNNETLTIQKVIWYISKSHGQNWKERRREGHFPRWKDEDFPKPKFIQNIGISPVITIKWNIVNWRSLLILCHWERLKKIWSWDSGFIEQKFNDVLSKRLWWLEKAICFWNSVLNWYCCDQYSSVIDTYWEL